MTDLLVWQPLLLLVWNIIVKKKKKVKATVMSVLSDDNDHDENICNVFYFVVIDSQRTGTDRIISG